MDVLGATAGAPDSVALVGSDRVWTFRQLADLVEERAAAMRAEREASADVEGALPLVVGSGVEAIVDLLGAWRAGIVPAPLNHRLTEAERETARARLAGAELPRGTQVVLWTSGTSGHPRGVALSFENLRAITNASRERLSLTSDDVWLASLSAAHVGGLVLVVRAVMLGSAIVVPSGVGVDSVAALLASAEPPLAPTHVSMVPTQLHQLLEVWGDGPAPPHLRCLLLGGAHAPASLVERAIGGGWPVALTYGATEMSSQIATAPPEMAAEGSGTVGRPLPGVEVRIDESGEIRARGATRALGFVGADAAPLSDPEGWYATGDLGRLDSGGRLHVVGRRIDRIVSGGVTIDAVEVEEALRADPTLVDACVVGIPDPEWGELVGALVVPVEGEFDQETAEGHLRERLMSAKVPRVWCLAAALPRNANGKVDRTAARFLLTASRSTRPS